MGQVDAAYEPAIRSIMKWADAGTQPDLDHGWPGADTVTRGDGNHELNSAQFDKYLRNLLMEKAVGAILTKVVNGETKGGVYMYTDIYKWFTETSGIGLSNQASKLMTPEPVKREEELTERIEDWLQKK